ncbi:2-succinyl-5-enolpyruvyl-6-hydroxy-3-cyclohexene-1-carboxylate synthase [Frankliniella fusca]|uniref:2-succinyl-5-enolpyruvyl-6-hydroxy-3-cyclohexene-1-carboxylate synthase n=1 Tax=Frankliniella fusca TaxID=407009 RepID=A0AAE1HP20_9NEOP|nr:2-succinyl-5-enolpyruvyl-6-hydroxy-3-cyclohexene-1-carboxylate synthase [Frankliniella fusca]
MSIGRQRADLHTFFSRIVSWQVGAGACPPHRSFPSQPSRPSGLKYFLWLPFPNDRDRGSGARCPTQFSVRAVREVMLRRAAAAPGTLPSSSVFVRVAGDGRPVTGRPDPDGTTLFVDP